MALQNLFGDLNLEASQQELLSNLTLILAAILEKMPRVDGNDRVITTTESAQPVTVSSGTVTTVTTVGTVTAVGNMANFGTSLRAADAIPTQLSNMGVMHIYDNIRVS